MNGGVSSPGGSPALPPIDECLFGPTRACPRTLSEAEEAESSRHGDGDNPNDRRRQGMDAAFSYDSLYLGHWGDAAQHHDIPMAKLRRICSQGIADEGSYRGIAWRVLLGYLPPTQIHKSWPKAVQPQRELYQSLIQQYLANPPDPGRELRGSLSKRLQKNNNLRQNYNKLRRLDEEDGKSDDDGDNGMDMGEDDTNGAPPNNSSSHSSTSSSSNSPAALPPQSPPEMVQTILEKLPPQFKDQWKKAGIRLDKSVATQTAVALGINHLAVPTNMETQEDFDVFLQDARLMEEIRKDVVRTHPDLYFFLEPQANLGLRRYAALERILFLWSKLNRGVRYVQGMNEIVGTIYYVLANDHNSDFAIHAEADTYFLFHTLMIEMRDVFVPDLDTSTTGIQGRIDNMQRLLQTHDPEVFEHLQECGIDASFFAIRWLTTLLSREFLLPDTIRLWDSMFASTHKENFLRYVCGTMVMMVRDELLKGDFSTCLRLLQSYPPANVDDILESSRSLWIYESQINIACHKGGISLHQALQTVSPPPAIIMAFALKGGVAPRIQEQIREVQEGLLGRAKRFWNGWGGSNDDEANNKAAPEKPGATSGAPAAPETAPKLQPTSMDLASLKDEAVPTTRSASPVPPRRRIWNRGRSNTNESNENIASLSGDEDTVNVVSPNSKAEEPTPPARRRIWNRGRSDSNDNQDEETTPAPAPRRRIWNRGGAGAAAADSAAANKNTAADGNLTGVSSSAAVSVS